MEATKVLAEAAHRTNHEAQMGLIMGMRDEDIDDNKQACENLKGQVEQLANHAKSVAAMSYQLWNHFD